MKNIILTAFILATSISFASPVNSMLGAEGNEIDFEEGIVPIEYLESTGTQWIDIDFSFSDSDGEILEIWCAAMSRFTDSSNAIWRWLIGNGGATKGCSLSVGFYWNQNWATGINTWGNIQGSSSTLSNPFFYGCLNRVEGTVYREFGNFKGSSSDRRMKGPFVGYPYALFASDIYGNGTYPAKIWYAKFAIDGIVKRDLIPVRIGDEGFMYDRVSGELFGNEGTGAFVLGPDL